MENAMSFFSSTRRHDELLSSARASLQSENQQIYPAPLKENRDYEMLLKRLDTKPSPQEILSAYCD
ncbi:hypothetical protein ACIOZM_29380 [Pseudomonas sp. NPDC087346]|uniref:hypothetical protein n=1 Tax=Pseudomonas sp. NPDC087346 TaxID=3364438 RepID=UPI00382B7B69